VRKAWFALWLLAFVFGCLLEVAALDYSACNDDPEGDVCQGRWDVLGLDPVCRGRFERPTVDIVSVETYDEISHVGFRTRVAGSITKSFRVMYGFRGTIGEGILGTKKHLTIWVIDGTAYLMTDLTRQLFPVKEPMATTIKKDSITVRIPKTDIGECSRWNIKAFAVEAEGNLGPGMMIASGYYDEVDLVSCPVPERSNEIVLIILLLGATCVAKYGKGD
jgi:hypothetical protein